MTVPTFTPLVLTIFPIVVLTQRNTNILGSSITLGILAQQFWDLKLLIIPQIWTMGIIKDDASNFDFTAAIWNGNSLDIRQFI